LEGEEKMKEKLEWITLNGVKIDYMPPRQFLSELFVLYLPMMKYAPDISLRKFYKIAWRMAAIYTRWVRRHIRIKRGLVRAFLWNEKKIAKDKRKLTRDHMIWKICEDILSGEGMSGFNDTGIFYRGFTPPKVQEVPALTETAIFSRKRRKRIPEIDEEGNIIYHQKEGTKNGKSGKVKSRAKSKKKKPIRKVSRDFRKNEKKSPRGKTRGAKRATVPAKKPQKRTPSRSRKRKV
jgi:hypothetical protein